MQRPTNFKIGDRFKVIENGLFDAGEIITLKEDDGTNNPLFWDADKSNCYFRSFSYLEPYPKTIRDVQVGDVVIDKGDGDEYLVLERGQSTVTLSEYGNFEVVGVSYTFDKLEKHFTLKDAPEVEQTVLTMDQIAEKFGVEVSRLKITKE